MRPNHGNENLSEAKHILVKNWKETLKRLYDLPVDWLHNREVLVGSGR